MEMPAESSCFSYGQLQDGQFQDFVYLTMIENLPGKKRRPASFKTTTTTKARDKAIWREIDQGCPKLNGNLLREHVSLLVAFSQPFLQKLWCGPRQFPWACAFQKINSPDLTKMCFLGWLWRSCPAGVYYAQSINAKMVKRWGKPCLRGKAAFTILSKQTQGL